MTIFQKIIDSQIPATIVYEDDRALAFRDVAPQAPVHVLVIPKPVGGRALRSLADSGPDDDGLLGHLLGVCRAVAVQEGLAAGYRVVTNIGADGGQSVDHLHFHVLGRRRLGWPPG